MQGPPVFDLPEICCGARVARHERNRSNGYCAFEQLLGSDNGANGVRVQMKGKLIKRTVRRSRLERGVYFEDCVIVQFSCAVGIFQHSGINNYMINRESRNGHEILHKALSKVNDRSDVVVRQWDLLLCSVRREHHTRTFYTGHGLPQLETRDLMHVQRRAVARWPKSARLSLVAVERTQDRCLWMRQQSATSFCP
jgi:hypothetical protein